MTSTLSQLTEERQADDWESLISAGIEARESADDSKWRLGDLATRVHKAYGKNKIGEYAKSINEDVDKLKSYRTVSAFWEKSVRTPILEDAPTLSYSHFRIAMRLKEMAKAVAFLECAASEAWTVERARVEMAKVKGKPVPPLRLLDAEARVSGVDVLTGHIAFRLEAGVDVMTLEQLIGRDVRLVVMEVKE